MPEDIKEPETPPVEAPPEEEKEIPKEEAIVEEPVLDDKGEEIKDPEKAIHFKKNEPPEGSKRWNDIYRMAKDGERAIAKATELETKLKETTEGIEALRKHNEELARVALAKKDHEEATAITTERKTDQQQLFSLRAARKQAQAEVDYDKALAIQDQIDDLIIKMGQTRPEEIKKVIKEEDSKELIDGFVKKAEWFAKTLQDGSRNPKYDPAKAGMAKEVELDLQATGKYTSYRDLLDDVKKTVEERFTEKAPTPPKTPVAGVAGVNLKEVPATHSVVQLNAEQKRVVRMMFGDDPNAEKKYAAQLKAMGRA